MDSSSDVQLINFETIDTVGSVLDAIDAAISSTVKGFNLLGSSNDVTQPDVPLIYLTQDSEEERKPGGSDGDSTPANGLTQDGERDCNDAVSDGDSTPANSLTQDGERDCEDAVSDANSTAAQDSEHDCDAGVSDANSTAAQYSEHDSDPNSSSANVDDQAVPDSTQLEPPRKKTKKCHHTAPPNTPVSFYGHDSDHDTDDEADDVTLRRASTQRFGTKLLDVRAINVTNLKRRSYFPFHFPQEELGLNPQPIDVADNTQMRMTVNTADLRSLCLEIRRYRDESALANARLIEEEIHNRGLIEAVYADLCTFRLEMRNRFDIQDRFIMDMFNELFYRFHNQS